MPVEKTMNLDYSFVEWLSTELALFRSHAGKYTSLENPVVIGGETMTQDEALVRIQQMIAVFQAMRTTGKGNVSATIQAIAMMWAEIIPHMWL